MQEFAHTIGIVSVFANVPPLLVACWRWRCLGPGQKTLVVLCTIGLLVQIASFALGKFQINNYFLFHLYIPVEAALFMAIFYYEGLWYRSRLPASKGARDCSAIARRRLMLVLGGIMAAFCLANAQFGEGWGNMPTKAFILEALLMVSGGILYFIQVFREMKIWKLESQPMFWITIGIWVYSLGGVLIILFDDFLQDGHEDAYFLVWGIHSCLVILTAILFAFALLCKTSIPKS